jgi:hypothetical protein
MTSDIGIKCRQGCACSEVLTSMTSDIGIKRRQGRVCSMSKEEGRGLRDGLWHQAFLARKRCVPPQLAHRRNALTQLRVLRAKREELVCKEQ